MRSHYCRPLPLYCSSDAQANGSKTIREITTHSAEETIAFGRTLAELLAPPKMVLLRGDLGAGKTTLVKGIAAAFEAAAEEDVTSPTFTLIHEYRGPKATLYHIDLYRIDTPREFETLALDDLRSDNSILLIEWGEKFPRFVRQRDSRFRSNATARPGGASGSKVEPVDGTPPLDSSPGTLKPPLRFRSVIHLCEPLVKPVQAANEIVAKVGGLHEHVSFVRINNQLRRNFHRPEGVVPLDRLLHRNFPVAVTNEDQGRCLDRLDEVHGIALGIHGGIVINRRSKKGNHPLVNLVYTVVADPVGEAGSGDSGGEAMRLRLRPHRHVPAIAVAANA